MIAFRTGYDIGTDLHHGFSLLLGKLLISCHWDMPQFIWYNRSWAIDEAGYIRGMPVARRKPKKWLLRGVCWSRKFEVKWL